MNGSLLSLVVCYALLALGLLALCLWSRWPGWVKSTAIVAFAALAMLNYEAMAGLLGFPTPGRLPAKFLFHSAVVVPPDPSHGQDGRIFLWATELRADGPARQPRSYELPYDQASDREVLGAREKIRGGTAQIGTVEEVRTSAGIEGNGDRTTRLVKPRLKLADRPDPALPEK